MSEMYTDPREVKMETTNQPVRKSLDDILADLTARVKALESIPTNNSDTVKEALDNHPLMVRFRAFLDKWQHPAG